MKVSFLIFLFSLIGLQARAQSFPTLPALDPKPSTEKLDHLTLDFIHGILATGRLSPQIRCRIEARPIKEIRKFSTGSQWVEMLEIGLFTDHLGPRSLKLNFPVNSKLSRRLVTDESAGTVEEIKLEIENSSGDWFLFRHDGTRVVWAEIGNWFQQLPCLQKD